MFAFIRDVVEYIFSIALFINALLFIPQIIRIIKEKSVEGVSLTTFLGLLLIQFAIVLHGLVIDDKVLVYGYLFSMLTCGSVVMLVLIFKKQTTNTKISEEEIISQLPMHVYWKNKSGQYLGSNTNNWKDFGLKSLNDIKSKTDYDIFPKKQADFLYKVDQEVIKTGQPKIIEEEVNNTNGTKTLYLSHKIPLKDKNGEIVGILGISVDISQAKQETTEQLEMLENIIAMMPGTVYWMNKDGIYLGCNDNEAKAIGLKSRKDIIGKRNVDIPGFLIPKALDPVNKEVMEKGVSILLEEPAILHDGTSATFLSNKTPLYNKDKEIVGMVGISVDITDRKEKEKLEIQAKADKKLLLEQAKFSKIVYQVVHDIRSPLASLNMLVTVCDHLPENDRLMIRDISTQISDIANNLLNGVVAANPRNFRQQVFQL